MHARFFSIVAGFLLAVSGTGLATGVATTNAARLTAGAPVSQTLLTVSCPSVSDCYAGGNNATILATRDGGATWQPQSWQPSEYVKAVSPVAAIACATVDNCFGYADTPCDALGDRQPLGHTTNGGSSWLSASIPGCGSSIACPTATTCYTTVNPVGGGFLQFVRTTDSGRSWQKQAKVDSNRLKESLACPAPTICYAAFQNAIGRTTDGGKHWTITHSGVTPCSILGACPFLGAIACPGQSTCYTGGSESQKGRLVAEVITSRDGFRTHRTQLIGGLDGVTALSCPTLNVCFALGGVSNVVQFEGFSNGGDTDRIAMTTDGGAHWRVESITSPYPFNALSCPSAGICYAAGFLGRLMGTRDEGATWHDLIPAIFVSGTYGATQPLHTYSGWFSATQPWQLAVGKVYGAAGVGGRRLPATACAPAGTVTVYVRNAQNQVVAGPIQIPLRRQLGGLVGRSTVEVTGKLRLDVVSHCSSFSVRVDGVEQP
jgi:photosystem II stability/assembly factor-like uncharacterized protein